MPIKFDFDQHEKEMMRILNQGMKMPKIEGEATLRKLLSIKGQGIPSVRLPRLPKL